MTEHKVGDKPVTEAGRGDANVDARPSQYPPDLAALIDRELISDVLADAAAEQITIKQVAEWLLIHPDEPLLESHFEALRHWVRARHKVDIGQGRRGAPRSPLRDLYPLVHGLQMLGKTHAEAWRIALAKNGYGEEHTESAIRQHRRDRDAKESILINLAGAVDKRDEQAFGAAMARLRGRTEIGD